MLTLTRLEGRDAPVGAPVFRASPDPSALPLYRARELPAAEPVFVQARVRDGVVHVGTGWRADPPAAAAPAIVAEPHAAAPGLTRQARLGVGLVPAGVLSDLAAVGVRVRVYRGPGVTVLPELTRLAAFATPTPGDGPRTYDEASSVYDVATRTAFIHEGDPPWVTAHELAHAVYFELLTPAQRDDWYFMAVRKVFPTVYERADPFESAAESLRRLWMGQAQDGEVAAFWRTALPGS